MVSAAICRHLRPHKHRRILQFSSSSSNSDSNHQHETTQSQSQSSSYFDDVKSSLRQTSPPPRKPSFIHSNRTAGDSLLRKTDPLEEIRKNLSTFRRSDAQSPPPPSSAPVLSFQELYRRNVLSQSDNLGSTSDEAFNTMPSSLKSIRLSLQNQLSTPSQSKLDFSDLRQSLKFRPEKVPESIVKGKKEAVTDEMKTEFVRTYSYGELGQKLMNLRAEVKRNEKIGFSLVELNERLKKLREVEEKEDTNMNGVMSGLRAGLLSLQISHVENKNKMNAAQRLGVIGQIIGTPNFMLSPPKEVLVEKYFHPDHMSSSEKQKLELKKVRDQFKMPESDCGSSRVQVAQLTTKIKHLASVLHQKDKHSRKGLQAMVQKRKKLLKYLRRTDWDSYCFCLTELGLRDSTDYKA